MLIAYKSRLLQIRWCGVAHSRKFTDFFGECRFPKKWPRGSDQSELLGQFRLISDRASDVSGGRICLTQNAYAEL